jgi:hypothetical protein
MIDNVDVGITITKDYDKDGNCYYTFHRIKMRDRGSNRDYICQPCVSGSEIRLVCDVGGIPQFKESIHVNQINNKTNIKMSGSSTMTNMIDNVLINDEDYAENAFAADTFTLDINDDKKTAVDSDKFLIDVSGMQDTLNDLMGDVIRSGNMIEFLPEAELPRNYQNPVSAVTFSEPFKSYSPISFGEKFDSKGQLIFME